MKDKTKNTIHTIIAWAILLIGITGCFDAFAQVPVGLADIYAAAESPTDNMLQMFKGILGEQFISSNPFSATGMPTTLVGDIFFIFNSIVFVIGTAYLAYIFIAMVAQSAQDGNPLGQNVSALWAPIRIGVGVIGMVPGVGGYSIFQAAMATALALGIGGGNIITSKLIQSASQFKAITPSLSAASAAPNMSADVNTFVKGAILAELCHQGKRYSHAEIGYTIEPPAFIKTDNQIAFDYNACGTLQVKRRVINKKTLNTSAVNVIKNGGIVTNSGVTQSTRSNNTIGDSASFRLNAVNYQQIATAVQAAAEGELKAVQKAAAIIAAEYMNEFFKPDAERDLNTAIQKVHAKAQELEFQVRSRLNTSIINATQTNESAISDNLLESIKRGGWTEIGSFYSVFSEVSAAVADAQRAFEFAYTAGPIVERAATDGKGKSPEMWAIKDFLALERYQKKPTDEKGLFDKLVDQAGEVVDYFAPESETGNRSIGQEMVNKLTRFATDDSGGAGLVNPVIAAKNLGDWMMIMGQTGLSAGFAADLLPAGRGAKIAGDFLPALQTLGDLFTTICYALVGIGMFLSLFVPMIFFMTWATAIATYIITMLQALVFAQFSAFAHLKSEGEGIAQSGSAAAKFYIYLLNALFRPALMVMGFVLASAALTLFGTWFVDQFASAMAAAQGNSMTGVLSAVGYSAIFAVMLFGSVQIFANLITELPDKMLGWIGGQQENGNSAIIGAAVGAAMRGAKGPAIASGAMKAVPKPGESNK